MSGLSASLTKACSTWLSIGRRSPASAATRELLPATATPTFPARIAPRVVSTPVIAPDPSRKKPVSSQFWMMSTPSAEAARA